MNQLRYLLRPTLVRRVVLALLLAFGLVWLVLMTVEYRAATDQQVIDSRMRASVATLLASIAHTDSTAEARATIAVSSSLINNSYRLQHLPGSVLLQLSENHGKRLFLSPEGGNAILSADDSAIGLQIIDGKPYRVFKGETAHWSLVLATPRFSDVWIVQMLSDDLTHYMLIALPCILLPLWFIVSRGLKPLQRLSDRIAAKDIDDLSPLNVEPKYAELKPLTEALDSLLAQLRNKIEHERTFVQDAAHELRTPMAVISAQAHVLVMASNPEQRQEAEQRLDHAIARASHLIQQLLALAHIDSDRDRQPCVQDVAQLVRQELALAAPAAMARHLDLSLEAPDVLVQTLDMHAFQSVLQNLLNNALRYVQDGGEVRVELKQHLGALTLSVADNGPGIADAEHAKVFERFYRGAGHDATGSGLSKDRLLANLLTPRLRFIPSRLVSPSGLIGLNGQRIAGRKRLFQALVQLIFLMLLSLFR